MTILVIVILTLIIVGLLFKDVIKKWIENAPSEAVRPRGGEKPINEFFSSGASEAPDLEVQEMADKLLDRIDRKIDVLRELIKQADKKIDALSRTSHVLPAEMPPAEPGERNSDRETRTRSRGGGVAAEPAAEDDKRAKIIQLRRRGLNPGQIAQEVKMGRGEVELILNIEGFNP